MPGVYPEPLDVIFPVTDWISTVTVAPVPPPSAISIVGAVSYPAPAESKVILAILPVCSSNTGVTAVSYTHLTLPTSDLV